MRYKVLDYCAFEHTFFSYCKKAFPTGQEYAKVVKPTHMNIDRYILLPAGLTDEIADEYLGKDRQSLTKDVLSNFRNHNKFHDYIIKYYSLDGAVDRAESFFSSKLSAVLFDEDLQKVVIALMDIANIDFNIPKSFITYIRGLSDSGNYYRFLAETFVFSIIRNSRDYSVPGNEARLSPIVSSAIEDCEHKQISSYVLGVIDKMFSDLFILCENQNLEYNRESIFTQDDALAITTALADHLGELEELYIYKLFRMVSLAVYNRVDDIMSSDENNSIRKLLKTYHMPIRVITMDPKDKIDTEFTVGSKRFRLQYDGVNDPSAVRVTQLYDELDELAEENEVILPRHNKRP